MQLNALAAAAAVLFINSVGTATTAQANSNYEVKCFGVNAAKDMAVANPQPTPARGRTPAKVKAS